MHEESGRNVSLGAVEGTEGKEKDVWEIAQLPNDSTGIKCYRKHTFKLIRTREQT